jgi:hypothetical protein
MDTRRPVDRLVNSSSRHPVPILPHAETRRAGTLDVALRTHFSDAQWRFEAIGAESALLLCVRDGVTGYDLSER